MKKTKINLCKKGKKLTSLILTLALILASTLTLTSCTDVAYNQNEFDEIKRKAYICGNKTRNYEPLSRKQCISKETRNQNRWILQRLRLWFLLYSIRKAGPTMGFDQTTCTCHFRL